MSEAVAVNPWVALLYLIAGVCFIMALRGLSSPESSRKGNRYGMAGMAIAVVTTFVVHGLGAGISGTVTESSTHFTAGLKFDPLSLVEILIAIAIGATIGLTTARRIKMTDMPQLVAAFHSLVGLAAVLVAIAAYANPGAFGILDAATGHI
ncbi:MAG TPA: NAD(P)(+) transhydrogenase (Re/Si-specific) subunit beta, partial [Sphingomonas sp.]